MKGKFLLRIYKHHDQDLIYLYRHPNFDFHKFVRQCLLNYFSDEKPFWAKMPEEIPKDKIPKASSPEEYEKRYESARSSGIAQPPPQQRESEFYSESQAPAPPEPAGPALTP